MNNIYEQFGEEKIDLLIDTLYDDIIASDNRINFLFVDGYERVKKQQKKFFRMFLGAKSNVFDMPNLKEKHNPFPITVEVAGYWLEDFNKALEKIDLDPVIKKFLANKVNTLGMHMINTIIR